MCCFLVHFGNRIILNVVVVLYSQVFKTKQLFITIGTPMAKTVKNVCSTIIACLFDRSGLRRFQKYFSDVTTVSGCYRRLNAFFYSAASLKYHAPDTTFSLIILTLGRPALALPRKSECQARSS